MDCPYVMSICGCMYTRCVFLLLRVHTCIFPPSVIQPAECEIHLMYWHVHVHVVFPFLLLPKGLPARPPQIFASKSSDIAQASRCMAGLSPVGLALPTWHLHKGYGSLTGLFMERLSMWSSLGMGQRSLSTLGRKICWEKKKKKHENDWSDCPSGWRRLFSFHFYTLM